MIICHLKNTEVLLETPSTLGEQRGSLPESLSLASAVFKREEIIQKQANLSLFVSTIFEFIL